MYHDAHNYERRVERFFERLAENKVFPEEDKCILKEYQDFLVSEGITFGRVGKYLTDLKKASELLRKNFRDAEEQDIRRIVSIYERNEKYSPWSKRDFKIAIRKFYTWLRKTKEYPPEVAWLKVHQKIRNTKTHEDILCEDDVKKLIEHSRTFQEKAFIATLYESGCRFGEIVHLKINQVRFDDYGAQLYVTGKTGSRRVRAISCTPYLVEWLNNHPFKSKPSAYFWISRELKPFSHSGVAAMLNRIARRAAIQKRVNPHNFRHSRASYLANHLTEAQMKEYFGWTQDSNMAAVYIHLSGRDVDKALLKIYGIKNDEDKKESIFKPKECTRCNQVNQATNRFCSRCGMPLDEESTAEIIKQGMDRGDADNVLDSLLDDQEFREMLIRKIKIFKTKCA